MESVWKWVWRLMLTAIMALIIVLLILIVTNIPDLLIILEDVVAESN